MTAYETVIGLEIHARINTASKMFCTCSNDTFNVDPNTHTCPVCMGFPGMLPLINKEAIHSGIKTGLALGCDIPLSSKFDRKNYFYPDLPSGYQISQYDKPLAIDGNVEVFVEGEKKTFGITRLHLENDAGKLSHTAEGTLVDWNRAGSPLMEIVTEPDFRSIAEVKAFLQTLQKILRYTETSDADMEKGMMRADVNISLRPKGQKELGTRSEMKNMNSFRAIEKAIAYEMSRQERVLESGEAVVQETRGWDEAKGKTISQRGKEEAADYRYFPEPDITPLVFTEKELDAYRSEVLELPTGRQERFMTEYSLSYENAETLCVDKYIADFFEQTVQLSGDIKRSSNWILSELLAYLKEHSISLQQCSLMAESLSEMIRMIAEGSISGKIGKDIFPEMIETGKSAKEMLEQKGIKLLSDTKELETICQNTLQENEQIVADFRGGKDKAFGALIGKVMAATKGQANPQMVNTILRKLLV